ncbi:ADP-ribosylglycohydrolase family protein [Marinospirillum minutulum]|uniref:ADP-ribosylglycohydrolase family protein n=1 Tax=Marinospirillum minutulum TaxID=64974 RepID=UPI0003FED0F4|nr:ADP-ribosylglycohydrolase family protein [Marinospirillum minutulum]
MKNLTSAYRGALLGLACGDALGAPVEFRRRDSFEPLTGMSSGGCWNLEAGQWTDDTSLALCLARSLVEKQGFCAKDQMQRYWRWYSEGYMSCTGDCFDIGNATHRALARFNLSDDPWAGDTNPSMSGNGALMRLAPAVLAAHGQQTLIWRWVIDSTRTTHASPDCIDAALVFANILDRVISGESLRSVLMNPEHPGLPKSTAIQRILNGEYLHLKREHLGDGFYVIEALENALWACWQGEDLESTLLLAANLGGDADTVAAIAGQLAGAAYGEEQLPKAWLKKLAWRKDITDLADALLALNQQLEAA